jgi:hypothetical protein
MKIIEIKNLQEQKLENVIKEAQLLSKISSKYVISYFDCFFDEVYFILFNFNFSRNIFILLWNMQMEKHWQTI